jgi:hypothetical protein
MRRCIDVLGASILYQARKVSGVVQINTTPLTFLVWYRIDAPNAPIQRRLLFTKPEK